MSLLDTENLPHLCTAKTRTRTKDAMGGFKDTFTTKFTDRACWRQPANASEAKRWQKPDQNITHQVYFNSDPDLDENDILVIGGDTMEVRSASHPDDSCGLSVVWSVSVELIR